MNSSVNNLKETKEKKEDGMTVTVQEKFYGDKLFANLLLLILLGVFAAGGLWLMLLLFGLQSPAPIYFNASERAELIPEPSLEEPNMAANALLNWVTENLMNIFTFNFVDYTQVLEEANPVFTKEGYESYLLALKNAKIIDQVVSNKYVLSSRATSAPQITKEGALANRYIWKIRAPMSFRYKKVNGVNYEDYDVIILVMRVPNNQSPFGVKILKLDMTLKRSV